MKRLYGAIFCLLAVMLVQAAFFYPRLPDRIASHFSWAGQANGWSSKEEFFLIYCSLILLMTVLFLVLPAAFRRIPVSMINLPNKDYWLGGPRKESAFLLLRGLMGWFGAAVILFNIILFQLVINANMSQEKILPAPAVRSLLAGFFIFVMIWLIGFYRKFKMVRE